MVVGSGYTYSQNILEEYELIRTLEVRSFNIQLFLAFIQIKLFTR